MPWWKPSSPVPLVHTNTNTPTPTREQQTLPTTITSITVPSTLVRSASTTGNEVVGRNGGLRGGTRDSLVETNRRPSPTVTPSSNPFPLLHQPQTPFALQCPTPSRLSVSPTNGNYFDRAISIPDRTTSCLPTTNTRTDVLGPKNITVTTQTPTPPDFTPPFLPTTLPSPRNLPFCFSFEYVEDEIRAPVELLSAHLWQCDTEPWADSWLEEAHVRLQALLAKAEDTNFSEYPNLFRNDDEEELAGQQPWRTVTNVGRDQDQPRHGRTPGSTSVTTLPLPAALFWGLQTGSGLQPSFGPDRTREAVARAVRLRNAFLLQSLTETDLMVATYATVDTFWTDEEKENKDGELNFSGSDSLDTICMTSMPPPPPPTALNLCYSNGAICLGMHKLSSYLWRNLGQGWIEHTRQRLHQIQTRSPQSPNPSSSSTPLSIYPSTGSAQTRMIPGSMQIKIIARALHSRTAPLDEALIVSLKLGPGTKNVSSHENNERYEMAVLRAAKLRDSFRGVIERVTEKEIEEWAVACG